MAHAAAKRNSGSATPMLREAGVPDALASRLEPAQCILVEAIARR
jgi:hypothetical protein